MIGGATMIALERQRQLAAANYDASHDDAHTEFELCQAARAYLQNLDQRLLPYGTDTMNTIPANAFNPPACWPWDKAEFKPTPDVIRQLAKAGALIAAEIDRLQRKGKTMRHG